MTSSLSSWRRSGTSWPSSGRSSRKSRASAPAYSPAAPVAEQAAVSGATSQAVRSLLAVVENYPQLRSQDNVLRLQGEIQRLEQQIADRRELYNDQVYRYNATIAQVPAVALAGLLGWKPRAFFDAEPAADEAPSVDLQPPGAADPDGRDAAR